LIHFVPINPSLLLHATYVPYDCPYTTNNTNIEASGGIRTHNPRKRETADPRLRPCGHWDRLFRSPDRPARSESLYRLRYRGFEKRYSTELPLTPTGVLLLLY
jgi:hypothetical protein